MDLLRSGVLPEADHLFRRLAVGDGTSWSALSRSAMATGSSQWMHAPPGPIRRHQVLHWSQRCSPRKRASHSGQA